VNGKLGEKCKREEGQGSGQQPGSFGIRKKTSRGAGLFGEGISSYGV